MKVGALVGHVAAGVIPEVAPAAEAHGFEFAPGGVAEEAGPVELAGERGVVELLRDIPVPLRLDEGDAAEDAVVDEFLRLVDGGGAAALHADLHNLF
jgi:hypothetical protein